MEKHAWEFSIKAMARVLDASRSGFYAWRQRKDRPSPRQLCREVRDAEIKAIFEAGKGRNGAIRVAKDLADLNVKCDRKTVSDSLRRQGLRAKAARKFKATTNSKHNLPVAPNLLEQDFDAEHPNQKWVGDITYLWTDEGWLYLAVMIDLHSRKVVGWAMSERMTATLVCDALRMALWRRKKPKGVIVHSDRGSQYCSKDYQKLIADHELLCSMSAKGNCYDNACAESFFHSLKVESIHGERFATRQAMKEAVFEYIEVDYNRTRRHSANGYLSPEAFEAQQAA